MCNHLDFRALLVRIPLHTPAQRWVNFDFMGSCCGLCPTWSWKSPRIETIQPLWTSCSNGCIPVAADRMTAVWFNSDFFSSRIWFSSFVQLATVEPRKEKTTFVRFILKQYLQKDIIFLPFYISHLFYWVYLLATYCHYYPL